ncbi:MAG: hypothetical protein ACFE0Q_18245 [Anaerolineae bacterium]
MRLIRELIIFALAIATVIYLFLPSVIPDFVPIVGWVDEGAATIFLLNVLKHWGIDLTGFFNRSETSAQVSTEQQPQTVRIPREVLEQLLDQYEAQDRAQSQ